MCFLMATENLYTSYLMRVWWEEMRGEPGDTAVWRAEVESIQTSQKWQFSDRNALFSFIETHIDGKKPDQMGIDNGGLS